MGRPQGAASTLLAFFFLLFSPFSFSGGYKMTTENAFSTLKEACCVESRLIDEGGEVSRVFRAYSFLAEQENAPELFEKLSNESSKNAGRFYALIWFFNHDKMAYEKAKLVLNEDDVVEVKIADILHRFSIREFVEKVEHDGLCSRLEMKSLRR